MILIPQGLHVNRLRMDVAHHDTHMGNKFNNAPFEPRESMSALGARRYGWQGRMPYYFSTHTFPQTLHIKISNPKKYKKHKEIKPSALGARRYGCQKIMVHYFLKHMFVNTLENKFSNARFEARYLMWPLGARRYGCQQIMPYHFSSSSSLSFVMHPSITAIPQTVDNAPRGITSLNVCARRKTLRIP